MEWAVPEAKHLTYSDILLFPDDQTVVFASVRELRAEGTEWFVHLCSNFCGYLSGMLSEPRTGSEERDEPRLRTRNGQRHLLSRRGPESWLVKPRCLSSFVIITTLVTDAGSFSAFSSSSLLFVVGGEGNRFPGDVVHVAVQGFRFVPGKLFQLLSYPRG